MAPERVAGAENGTSVRKNPKMAILKPPSTGPTTRKTATESAAFDDESTISLEKCKITSSTITTARDAVLNTPELLEAILSFLPVGAILCRSQRVCKNWKRTIATSPTIRTKLWFKSEATKPISLDLLSADHPFLASPRTEESENYRRRMKQNLPCYNGDVAYNPLFVGYSARTLRTNRMPWRGRLQAPVAGSPTYHQFYFSEFEELIGSEHSTWLNMYLTEPPVTTARLQIVNLPVRGLKYDYGDTQHISNELLHDARGLTFRTIMGRVNEVYKSGHWRTTRQGIRMLAKFQVQLFAGT